MATAGTVITRMRATSGFGFKGEPLTLRGYLAVSATFESGDVLIRSGVGTLTPAGPDPAIDTVIGVLSEIGPTYPALTGTPRERATTATVPNYNDVTNDTLNDKSVVFYPWIPGNIFIGHVIADVAFADDRFTPTDHMYTIHGITVDAANGLNDHYVFVQGASVDHAMTIAPVIPQATSVDAAGVLIQRPGPIVSSAATGTLNPLMMAVPITGLLF